MMSLAETWRAKGDNQTNQKRIQLVIPPLQKTETNNQETKLLMNVQSESK